MPKTARAQYLGSHKNEFLQTTFCDMFRTTVEMYPDKIAVSGTHGVFTYKELNEKSNTLAASLLKDGLKDGEIVGVRAGQSVWSVVCMLGIWKAGGAYVYIDSTHPLKRQNQIISECACRFILDEKYLSALDWTKDTEFINRSCLDKLALLIYTSGSTSSPKGVMLSHMNVMSSISNFDRFGLTEEDVYGIFPSFSFVASVFDLYSSLAVGASIYIIPKLIRKSVSELLRYYIENKITVTFLPPHMAAKFSNIENGETDLRLMIVGSEMARNLKRKSYRLFNVYGASEMTAMISRYDIEDAEASYPVGTLNPTIKGYIVDDDGHLVEDGEKGELWLASRQVSMGYYKDEVRTNQHFIKNPFSDEPGYDRVFKTSDVVRKNEDGDLEYIGRKDFMYKIRGFRVEAGAVETAMRTCGKIRDCAAIAFKDKGGTYILCGYFEADEPLDVKEIKAYLKERLPYYMVPTALFQMDELPRNLNNKIDRKAIKPPKELDDHKLLEKLY